MKKLLLLFLILFFSIIPSDAAIITSNAAPSSIYKCGQSIISATFSDAGIIGVNAIVASTTAVQPLVPGSGRITPETQSTTIPLAFNGTYWVGTFGSDNTLLWGQRIISYQVNTGVITTYQSSTTVFVYSDTLPTCTTVISNYTQISGFGFGNYTKLFTQGRFTLIGTSLETSFIGWALYPWIQVWGYIFYLIITFVIVSTIYMKTQNVTQPLIVGIFLLLVFAPSTYIDPIYRQWVLFIMGLTITALYYRVFVRD